VARKTYKKLYVIGWIKTDVPNWKRTL